MGDGAGVTWLGRAGILVHQSHHQFLVQAAPVDADAHRLVVAAGGLDHAGELFIPFPAAAHVAGIDAVLGQGYGTGGMFGQQLVAVEMEIADQRDGTALAVELFADVRHRRRGLFGIDGDAHQFRARLGQLRHLGHRGLDIGGVRIGHGLHHHGGIAAHGDGADVDGDGAVALVGGRQVHGVSTAVVQGRPMIPDYGNCRSGLWPRIRQYGQGGRYPASGPLAAGMRPSSVQGCIHSVSRGRIPATLRAPAPSWFAAGGRSCGCQTPRSGGMPAGLAHSSGLYILPGITG